MQHGEVIFQKRARLVDVFLPFFNEYYQIICQSSEHVGLQYISQLRSVHLEEKLAEDRERERTVGYTLTGIHKDDLEMTLNDSLIRHIGSQGQNKTYLIAMKLAQFSFLATQSSTMPILLLDDIFDKLDAERVEQIIQLVGGDQFGQIFITDTNRKYLDQMLKAIQQPHTVFKVEAGQVLPMEGEV